MKGRITRGEKSILGSRVLKLTMLVFSLCCAAVNVFAAIGDVSLTAGMRSNLLSLQNTSPSLAQTQTRLSTGKKVNSALDNPTNFFAAQAHVQRASDLSDRRDGMSEAVQTVKAADNGIKAITGLIAAAKGLESATSTTDSKATAAYQLTYEALLNQINDLSKDSVYKGTNSFTGIAIQGLGTLTGVATVDGLGGLSVSGTPLTVAPPNIVCY